MRSETGSAPPLLLLLLFLLPLFLFPPSAAQPDLSDGVRCLANRSVYPCQAYAFYRANLAVPLSADLASVGDLFGTSRALIARTTNLTVARSVLPLRQDQPLLVPITCGCDRNRSYYPAAYEIIAGNTFYLVSTVEYANLTAYPAVELVNPTLVPEDLAIGVIATFPIFCQCLPNNTIGGRRVLGLVSYVLQPSDTYASVASSFGVEAETLTTINGPFNGTYSVVFVPLLQIPPPVIRDSVVSEAPASPPTAPTPVVERNENRGVIAGLAAALAVVVVLCALLLLLLAWCRRRWNRKGEAVGKNGRQSSLERSGKGGGEGRFGSISSADDKLIADISEWLDKYKVFDVATLREATGGFDRSQLIQGSVYKGTIDGELFAVKKMKWNAYDELKILQKVNHSNLVKLEGFCIDGKEGTTYLVYEYVVNGSLDTWLHSPADAGVSDGGRRLDWRSRLRIALDVANGLQYIHEHTWPRVVHKDIKSSNVLLDASFHAKIANFGLARTGLNAVTTHIVGTQGYVAPEYLADGIVSIKMDVFAFGVVLLELVSGRPAFDERTGEALWSEAERLLFRRVTIDKAEAEALLLEWMDTALVQQSCPVESVMSVIQVARACLHRDPAKRPTMVEATYLLSKADEHFSDYSGDGLAVVGDSEVAAR
ncbi:serine/threonine receptor-like kinase NFP [Curcuma longa]|uniref:serine/threonine receptor-like kinase NFP n=1 Tax=Curcuma longa TaxID=136217 RepID=UPI003D9DD618